MQPSDYMALRDYELNRRPALLDEARKQRLLREAGLSRRSRPMPLTRRLLGLLGALLALAGGWLVRRATPAAPQRAERPRDGVTASSAAPVD